jgi:antitoxin MazE
MVAVVKKWGNSLGIRLPYVLAKSYSLQDGSTVELENTNNGIYIVPKHKETLSALLNKITPENIHEEIDTGTPRGEEIW